MAPADPSGAGRPRRAGPAPAPSPAGLPGRGVGLWKRSAPRRRRGRGSSPTASSQGGAGQAVRPGEAADPRPSSLMTIHINPAWVRRGTWSPSCSRTRSRRCWNWPFHRHRDPPDLPRPARRALGSCSTPSPPACGPRSCLGNPRPWPGARPAGGAQGTSGWRTRPVRSGSEEL